MKCAVVIVNYRTPQLAIDCLRSLAQDEWVSANSRVIVVDNDSPDDSCRLIAEAIAREGWSWCEVVPAGRNGGFAFGNNVGIRHLMRLPTEQRPAHVFLLNPDTIIRTGTVQALAEFLDGHPEVGVVGSGLVDADGKAQCSAHRFHSPLSELDRGAKLGVLSRALHRFVVSPLPREEPLECDWVSGASMMVRREVFDAVGLLDEQFFLYFEEVEFCRRVGAGGWRIWCLPAVRVFHLEGQATGVTDQQKRRARYWFESRRRYFVTGYGVGGLVMADFLWALGTLSFAARRFVQRKPRTDPQWFALDLLWGDFKAVVSGKAFRITAYGVQSS